MAEGADMGLAPLINISHFDEITNTIFQALDTGIHRSGEPTDTDGGVMAFDAAVEPLMLDTTFSEQSIVIAGFGGTNWQAGTARIRDNQVEIEMVSSRSFPASERQFASKEDFFETMVDVILSGFSTSLPTTLALSFGFLHHNHWAESGLDAVVPVDAPAKFWHIEGMANSSISAGLIAAAHNKNWNLEKIYVANDTVGSVLSQPGSSMAMVAGTGVNAAIALPSVRQGHILNLEVGRAVVLPVTESFEWLFARGLLPSNQPCLEYASGGEFHRYHLMALAGMAGESEAVLEAIRVGTPSLVSDIVFDSKKALGGLPPRTLHDDWWLEHSQAILSQTSLVLASLVLGLLKFSSKHDDKLLVEGSVFWVAPGVSDQVLELVEKGSSRRLHPVKAPGMEGLVRLALSR